MNKKAIIVTIYDTNNYGNRLQNYAVQELLKEFNIDAYTAKVENFDSDFSLFKWVYIKRFKNIIKEYLFKNRRVKKFRQFNKRYIKHLKRYYNGHKIQKWKSDYYVTGSDQIWNPNLNRMSRTDLLLDFPKEKSFALSASMGIKDLTENDIEIFVKSIDNLKGISVREKQAQNIVEKYTANQAIVLLDPTMLIQRGKWEQIEEKMPRTPTHYILTYFLEKQSEEAYDKLQSLSQEMENAEIIEIMDVNSFFHNAGPSEFIYLIHHADLIVTDSFHATVFSILFHKNFFVLDRKFNGVSMSSRIESLLACFSLENRFINHLNEITLNLEPDWRIIETKLADERNKAHEFISRCISN